MLCGWEGNRMSGVALAMRHRLSGSAILIRFLFNTQPTIWEFLELRLQLMELDLLQTRCPSCRPTSTSSKHWRKLQINYLLTLDGVVYLLQVRLGSLYVIPVIPTGRCSTSTSEWTVLQRSLSTSPYRPRDLTIMTRRCSSISPTPTELSKLPYFAQPRTWPQRPTVSRWFSSTLQWILGICLQNSWQNVDNYCLY